MAVAPSSRSPSNPVERGELVGTIAGFVVLVPLLAAMGYGAWLLVHILLAG